MQARRPQAKLLPRLRARPGRTGGSGGYPGWEHLGKAACPRGQVQRLSLWGLPAASGSPPGTEALCWEGSLHLPGTPSRLLSTPTTGCSVLAKQEGRGLGGEGGRGSVRRCSHFSGLTQAFRSKDGEKMHTFCSLT